MTLRDPLDEGTANGVLQKSIVPCNAVMSDEHALCLPPPANAFIESILKIDYFDNYRIVPDSSTKGSEEKTYF